MSAVLILARSRARYGREHIILDGYTLCGLNAAAFLPREVPNEIVARHANLCSRCWHAANAGGVRTPGGLLP